MALSKGPLLHYLALHRQPELRLLTCFALDNSFEDEVDTLIRLIDPLLNNIDQGATGNKNYITYNILYTI